MKKRILIPSISIIAISSFITTVNAYHILRGSGFSPVPTNVECFYEFSEETKTAIHNACAAWNSVSNSGDLVYRSTTTHSNTTFPNTNGRNQITKRNLSSQQPIMENIMSSGVSGYIAYECDINMNVYYPFGTASTSYDIETNMTHELGHLLGLGHPDALDDSAQNDDAIMIEGIRPGQVKYITNDDINGINSIYN